MEKAIIMATEGSRVRIEAMFNPSQLTINTSLNWASHKGRPGAGQPLGYRKEFTDPRTQDLGCTLLFDGYEKGIDVHERYIKKLESLTQMDPALGRPPLVLFCWGKTQFEGVVRRLDVSYKMFLSDGTRVRAEVVIGMEAALKAETSIYPSELVYPE